MAPAATFHTASGLHAWARRALNRESIVFHRGFIAIDRLKNVEVDGLAWAAEQLAADGVINIVQARRPNGIFEYIAQRTRRPHVARKYGEWNRAYDRDPGTASGALRKAA